MDWKVYQKVAYFCIRNDHLFKFNFHLNSRFALVYPFTGFTFIVIINTDCHGTYFNLFSTRYNLAKHHPKI